MNEIKIKQYGVKICDIFESLLDEHDITIPSDDREGDENEARLYGKEYYDTEDSINSVLTDLANKIKENPEASINIKDF